MTRNVMVADECVCCSKSNQCSPRCNVERKFYRLLIRLMLQQELSQSKMNSRCVRCHAKSNQQTTDPFLPEASTTASTEKSPVAHIADILRQRLALETTTTATTTTTTATSTCCCEPTLNRYTIPQTSTTMGYVHSCQPFSIQKATSCKLVQTQTCETNIVALEHRTTNTSWCNIIEDHTVVSTCDKHKEGKTNSKAGGKTAQISVTNCKKKGLKRPICINVDIDELLKSDNKGNKITRYDADCQVNCENESICQKKIRGCEMQEPSSNDSTISSDCQDVTYACCEKCNCCKSSSGQSSDHISMKSARDISSREKNKEEIKETSEKLRDVYKTIDLIKENMRAIVASMPEKRKERLEYLEEKAGSVSFIKPSQHETKSRLKSRDKTSPQENSLREETPNDSYIGQVMHQTQPYELAKLKELLHQNRVQVKEKSNTDHNIIGESSSGGSNNETEELFYGCEYFQPEQESENSSEYILMQLSKESTVSKKNKPRFHTPHCSKDLHKQLQTQFESSYESTDFNSMFDDTNRSQSNRKRLRREGTFVIDECDHMFLSPQPAGRILNDETSNTTSESQLHRGERLMPSLPGSYNEMRKPMNANESRNRSCMSDLKADGKSIHSSRSANANQTTSLGDFYSSRSSTLNENLEIVGPTVLKEIGSSTKTSISDLYYKDNSLKPNREKKSRCEATYDIDKTVDRSIPVESFVYLKPCIVEDESGSRESSIGSFQSSVSSKRVSKQRRWNGKHINNESISHESSISSPKRERKQRRWNRKGVAERVEYFKSLLSKSSSSEVSSLDVEMVAKNIEIKSTYGYEKTKKVEVTNKDDENDDTLNKKQKGSTKKKDDKDKSKGNKSNFFGFVSSYLPFWSNEVDVKDDKSLYIADGIKIKNYENLTVPDHKVVKEKQPEEKSLKEGVSKNAVPKPKDATPPVSMPKNETLKPESKEHNDSDSSDIDLRENKKEEGFNERKSDESCGSYRKPCEEKMACVCCKRQKDACCDGEQEKSNARSKRCRKRESDYYEPNADHDPCFRKNKCEDNRTSSSSFSETIRQCEKSDTRDECIPEEGDKCRRKRNHKCDKPCRKQSPNKDRKGKQNKQSACKERSLSKSNDQHDVCKEHDESKRGSPNANVDPSKPKTPNLRRKHNSLKEKYRCGPREKENENEPSSDTSRPPSHSPREKCGTSSQKDKCCLESSSDTINQCPDDVFSSSYVLSSTNTISDVIDDSPPKTEKFRWKDVHSSSSSENYGRQNTFKQRQECVTCRCSPQNTKQHKNKTSKTPSKLKCKCKTLFPFVKLLMTKNKTSTNGSGSKKNTCCDERPKGRQICIKRRSDKNMATKQHACKPHKEKLPCNCKCKMHDQEPVKTDKSKCSENKTYRIEKKEKQKACPDANFKNAGVEKSSNLKLSKKISFAIKALKMSLEKEHSCVDNKPGAKSRERGVAHQTIVLKVPRDSVKQRERRNAFPENREIYQSTTSTSPQRGSFINHLLPTDPLYDFPIGKTRDKDVSRAPSFLSMNSFMKTDKRISENRPASMHLSRQSSPTVLRRNQTTSIPNPNHEMVMLSNRPYDNSKATQVEITNQRAFFSIPINPGYNRDFKSTYYKSQDTQTSEEHPVIPSTSALNLNILQNVSLPNSPPDLPNNIYQQSESREQSDEIGRKSDVFINSTTRSSRESNHLDTDFPEQFRFSGGYNQHSPTESQNHYKEVENSSLDQINSPAHSSDMLDKRLSAPVYEDKRVNPSREHNNILLSSGGYTQHSPIISPKHSEDVRINSTITSSEMINQYLPTQEDYEQAIPSPRPLIPADKNLSETILPRSNVSNHSDSFILTQDEYVQTSLDENLPKSTHHRSNSNEDNHGGNNDDRDEFVNEMPVSSRRGLSDSKSTTPFDRFRSRNSNAFGHSPRVSKTEIVYNNSHSATKASAYQHQRQKLSRNAANEIFKAMQRRYFRLRRSISRTSSIKYKTLESRFL